MSKAIGMDPNYEAENDLRTLCDAAEINKDPKRLKAAQAMARKKVAEMENISGGENDADD